MAAHGRDDDKPFLSRWSQRKRQAEEAAPDAEARDATEAEPAGESEDVDPAELPDIDSLDASSDFTVFMRKGVPTPLKQRALRRLWQVDPAFKHICMLDDYNLDYTDAATVVPNLKTLFQVGRGMVLPEDELPAPKPGQGPEQDELAAPAPGPSREARAAASAERPAPATGAAPGDAEQPQTAAAGDATPPSSAPPASRPSPRLPSASATRSASRRRWGDPEA